MPPGKSFRPRGWGLPVAMAAVACALAPASAPAAAPPPGQGPLSPRLAVLAQPSVRSLPPAKQARALSLARSGPGSLLRRGNRVVVEVRFERGAAAGADPLRAAGGQVLDVSRRYQTVTVAAKPAELRALARVAGVAGVREVLTPMLFSTESSCPQGVAVSEGDEQLRAAEAREAFGVDGEGVTVGILSDSFDQAAYAVRGKKPGEPVATHAPEDAVSGDLPGFGNPCGLTTPVNVLENDRFEPEKEEPADEGRAMAQIVHDLAPGAKLAFASAFNGELDFAEGIERLAEPVSKAGGGARVIADDVAYLDEPLFQDGPVAEAINRVTSKGVAYFTAAGNDNLIEEPEPGVKNEIGSWEAPEFRDSKGCPAGVPVYAEHCMNFNPESGPADSGFGITVGPKSTLIVDLQWAQPWLGVTTDLDAYLLKEGVKAAESQYPNTDPSVQEPVEILGWTNESEEPAEVELAIDRCEEACGIARAAENPKLAETEGGDEGTPRLKFILLENGGSVRSIEYPVSTGADVVGPTIFGHAGAASAISLGAIRFNKSSEPEGYSSRGPVEHYFGPVEGTSPAPALAPPEAIPKPDLAATDCGVTTFFASYASSEGVWRFCGTSAAAPHAAAVAALMLDADPALTPTQMRKGLSETASPVGSFGADVVGAGLVNALGAVGGAVEAAEARAREELERLRRASLPPTITITERPAALSRDSSPSFGFSADQPVSFACALDGGQPEPCSSPFTPLAPLADGRHRFAVTGVNTVGLSGTSETVLFTIDTTPPRAFFRRHPRRLIRTPRRRVRAAFRFGSSEAGGTFTCRVDGGPRRRCGKRLSRRFSPGSHVLRVWARDAAGNVSRPAVFRFRVVRVS